VINVARYGSPKINEQKYEDFTLQFVDSCLVSNHLLYLYPDYFCCLARLQTLIKKTHTIDV
jgi:hypothetical protein